MFKHEFQSIVKHKGLMWAMLVILFIPFAYSFCFLTSAWDPYGNTGKIPVAVVNLDQPAELEGEPINAGHDTVAELKDDKQLKWIFCTPEQAKKGLASNKYYTVVTLPKDFSANAATLLDAHPKQMKLTYQTNGSLNYVSEIISQVGADKLNAQIREKVTTAFAQALFAKVSEIGSQLKVAKNGANKLVAGQTTLKDGLGQYTAGVSQVDGGLSQMNGQVPALASGVAQLTDGGSQLQSGLGQLNGKAPALASGVGQLNGGLATLNSKTPALASGVSQLQAGGVSIHDNLGKINGQVNGKTAETDLTGSVQKLTDGLDQLYKAVSTKTGDDPKFVDAIDQLTANLEQIQTATKELPSGASRLSAAMSKLHKTVTSQIGLFKTFYNDAKYPAVASMMGTGSGFDTEKKALVADLNTSNKQMQAAIDAVSDPDQKAALEAAFAANKKASGAVSTKLGTAYMVLNTVKYNLTTEDTDPTVNPDTGEKDPKGLLKAVGELDDGLSQINLGLNTPRPAVGTDAQYTFAQGLAALVAGLKKLQVQAPTLVDGVKQLDEGINALNKKAPQLASDINQLYNGAGQLSGGLNQLNGQVPALTSGVSQLYAGSTQLNNAVPALQSGVKQLYDGSVKEAAGLNELNGKVPTLTSGVKQLYDGTQQLTAKNKQLTSGADQLLDGNTQLATGLDDGYQQIVATKLTKLTAKMFAAPAQDVQLKYTTVKNYGAALAPYVLALAMFVAIIIFNFAYPMKRTEDDDRSPLAWLLGKLAIGTLVAVAAALIEATLMLLMMHLPVANVAGFYAMTLLFALAAQYLTMVLNLAFGRAGIFIALGLLTLSGSGGLFPAETISPLYESTQKFLPMTYAINGYREVITGGMATDTTVTSVVILLAVGLISLALMIPAVMMHQGLKTTD
ncbi:YhgE/Pip family protein [Lacticaseibacillus kribbianus]|uniref:YhgE/Pip family protein n=1 Tax=Lacticaseibacillus kribbianus TaxID=2926292 RepID=UPI001CD6BEDC|nr:YhgE/Pip domain-containing protein [Lacticaseibacillus kribbianus]